MTGRIVVGVDGSPAATAAVEWAADDAARRGAALRVVHVREEWAHEYPFHAVPGFDESLTEYCEGVVGAAAERARGRAPGVEVTTALAEGTVIGSLMAEAGDAGEIVLGSRGMGGFTGLVLGSVSIGVAGRAPCPVVVVRGPSQAVHGEVVVGLDGSSHSEAALEYGFAQARLRKARLRAVHAWQIPASSPFALGYADVLDEVFQRESAGFRRRLEPWRDKHPDVEVAESVVSGHPVAALSDASRQADLVVVGSRGLGRVAAAVLGSVGHGVLHHAHCPVAVVRPRRTAGDEDPG
ncbi:universal stress protein [Microbispora sp. NPDC049125]|uniref:universal stress protein n=1 Tax=Microbispora sp. NPDC049125 TaxID=3154929 RepID=UPI003465F863